MKRGRSQRPRLRTRVLVGVLTVTLAALAAFDVAAVAALRGYLIGRTDSQLQDVLDLYKPMIGAGRERQPYRDVVHVPGAVLLNGRHRAGRTRVPARCRAAMMPVAGTRAKALPGGPELVPKQGTVVGPRLQVAAPILDQYYVGFVQHASHRSVELSGAAQATGSQATGSPDNAVRVNGALSGLVQGDPNLTPKMPPNLAAVAAHWSAITVPSRNGNAQLRLLAVNEAGGTLVATTSLAGVTRTTGQLELILALGSAAAALLAGLGAALVMRRGLRPIEAMAAQADAITAGDLTERVGPQDPRTEVGRLGTALNGMLTRIEASVSERDAAQELTRRFFADASHELRNPLASLRANAELYQQGALREPHQVDEAMHRIAHEAKRMSALVDDMLRLARLDQHPEREHGPVDLSALVRECADRAQTADPQRTWHIKVATGLVTDGDEELLRQAIDNLLANVHTHTPEGTVATLTATRTGDDVTVAVSDDGPGVPGDQLPRIFERFYRGPAPSPRPGSGLGLAVVSAIVTAHHGTAEAAANHPHGLCVTLTLPAH